MINKLANMSSVLCFGELLWDILEDNVEIPGGAPMNVAYHLNKNNITPLIITRVGNDDRGDKMISILSNWGLETINCQIDLNHPTGTAYTHILKEEVSYEFPFPSAWDFIEWNENYIYVAKTSVFVFGSLVARNEVSETTLYRLLEVAPYRVFDVNLRTPHYTPDQIKKLLHFTDLLKLNENEVILLGKWFSPNSVTTIEIITVLFQLFSISEIIVTKGNEGATYYNNKNKIFNIEALSVKVADTIGSGDSFLAGFLANRMAGDDIELAMQKASVLGAFVTSQYGACPSYNLSDIDCFSIKHAVV